MKVVKHFCSSSINAGLVQLVNKHPRAIGLLINRSLFNKRRRVMIECYITRCMVSLLEQNEIQVNKIGVKQDEVEAGGWGA